MDAALLNGDAEALFEILTAATEKTHTVRELLGVIVGAGFHRAVRPAPPTPQAAGFMDKLQPQLDRASEEMRIIRAVLKGAPGMALVPVAVLGEAAHFLNFHTHGNPLYEGKAAPIIAALRQAAASNQKETT